jgi:carboxypeptidase Taq
MTQSYRALAAYSRETATVRSLGALAGWDQETYMPSGGADLRGSQKALVARLEHERLTGPRMLELLSACENDPGVRADAALAASVKEYRRDVDLACKLPGDLVAEIAGTSTKAVAAWREARAKNDFSAFAPWLERMVGLARRKAECYGTPAGGEPYDALLNEYEPGATAREIDAVFKPLRTRLADFIKDLARGTPPDESPLNAAIPPDRQHEFGLFVLRSIGFDLERGRLDVTTHPFCDGIGPGDTRLTTRYRESRFTDALYGTLHEAGHGLYEQGLPKGERFGEPLAEAVSLGIHESQSRLWENWVGRSAEFWAWAMPHAKSMLGVSFGSPSPEAMARAVNTAKPSFIRVEADEATYNMHVMVRFELERALFSRQIEARDVPGLWNKAYASYLGITPPDDARGCMQDVHWSAGLLGYFPTYTLGNLYMAQFMEAAQRELPGLRAGIARGEFAPLLTWLREKIHVHGKRFRAAELCQRVTGAPLSADPFMRYLEAKLRPVYGRA